ncbi:MAG: extracellular solute-binding protein [Fimbriimonadales bacterium]|nr:extracellular solute-binding protein [Fimbriimonadales bacterium]
MVRCRFLFPLLALLALASPGSADSRQTVTVWGMGLGPDSQGLQDVIREFERRNPRYRVRILSMGAGGMNPQKLMTAIVGKVPPDVIFQDRFSISDWASRGAFRPLDDLIARDRGRDPLTPTPDQYYPAFWQEACYGGRVYGIPASADTRALYWNKRVFRENAAALRAAGLDPNRPPRTWSETLAYSRVLTKFNKDGSLRQAGFIPNYGNSWLYLYAFQMNASFLSPDGRTCTLYSPESEAALRFMVEGYRLLGGYEQAQKFQSTFQSGENDPFIVGKVAMKIDGDWIIPWMALYAPKLDFATAPPPVPDDRFHHRGRFRNEKDTFISWAGGFAYAIPVGAKNVEGGWAFIKFITSTEGRLIEMRGQNSLERKRGRTYMPRVSAQIQAGRIGFETFKPSDPRWADTIKLHLDLASVSRIRPATFVAQVLWDEHVRAVENAASGRMTPKEALLAGQRVVQQALDEELGKTRFPVIDLRLPAAIGVFGFLVGCGLLAAAYRRQRLGRLARHEAIAAYLFVSPWVVGFVVFTLGPMLASLFFSFTQYGVLTEARWVGLKNYVDLFTLDQQNIVKSFANVLYLGGIGVPLGLVTGLAVALLLNSAVRGMRYYRTMFYLPAIVPGVASVVLWMWILNADPNRGLISFVWARTISQWFGTQPPGWLTVEAWAKPSLILMGLWGAGSGMILWLAGLKGIPSTLYEAASIDGANPRQQFWAVTLPQLSPIVFFNTVMGFIGALQQFEGVYIITGGNGTGPGDSLLMPVYHLFNNGFKYFKMGYASALAWVIFAIILVLTGIQFLLARKWVHYEAGGR